MLGGEEAVLGFERREAPVAEAKGEVERVRCWRVGRMAVMARGVLERVVGCVLRRREDAGREVSWRGSVRDAMAGGWSSAELGSLLGGCSEWNG